MTVSKSGVFNTKIVGAVVELDVRYYQRVVVATVCRLYREPRLKCRVDVSV